MNLIQKEVTKINYIVDQYVDDLTTYKTEADLIVESLKSIIDELAPSFHLVTENSVRKIKCYSLTQRVKEADSLKEKVIRNNLLNKFDSLLPEGFIRNGKLNRAIKDKLCELDDLIGIKILTDLNVDCKKMFELIKSAEFKDKSASKAIQLDESDLNDQPQRMRNGLDIYKIKAKFKTFNFELQIKSKITSAWGDMEHSIFYKDYAITPVRDTAQKSMNHVGKLLFDIDDFVESIRSANKNYESNANALLFLSWFDESYSRKVKDHLNNVPYRFEVIAELLYQTSILLELNRTNPIKNLRFDHFEIMPEKQHLINYALNRNKSYDLKILEAVIVSWQLNETLAIDKTNIDTILSSFIELVVKATAHYLNEVFVGFDIEDIQNQLNELCQLSLLHECDGRFLINLHKIMEYFETIIFINEITEGLRESSENDRLLVDIIKKAAYINWHGGRSSDFITNSIADHKEQINQDDFKKVSLQIQSSILPNEKRDVINFKNLLIKLITT